MIPTPKKSLGQNFLRDFSVVDLLINTAQLDKNHDIVLEIGAGTGVVTQELALYSKKVIAVEFDRDLIPSLKKKFEDVETVEIVAGDILKLLERKDASIFQHPAFHKIVGSIPYQITSPLLHKLLIHTPQAVQIILLIQKEVAEKICAEEPKASYFSNLVKAVGTVEYIETVKPSAFYPKPKVDSAIIRITKTEQQVDNLEKFSKFLHKAFKHPRKMLHHTFEKKLLESVQIDYGLRPQEVKFTNWVNLYNKLTHT